MASTQAGDLVELLQQKAFERMITGSQIYYKLLVKANLSTSSPQMSDDFIGAITQGFAKLNPIITSMMQRAGQTQTFLETGQRAPIIPPLAVDMNSIVAAAKATTNMMAFKKAGGYGGQLSPKQLEDTYNFAGQTLAQKNADQAHEIIMRQHEQWLETQERRRGGAAFFARMPDSGACKFCMRIVTRGAVFKRDTAGFKAHNSCKCRPVFAMDDNWSLPPSKQAQVAAYMEEVETETYQMQKAKKAGNEALVKYGYRKRVVTKTPRTKTVLLEDGSEKVVPDGFVTSTRYVKTQKARDLEVAKTYKDTPAYSRMMNPAKKPLAHESITKETFEEEMARLQYDLGIVDDDGNALGLVDNEEAYKFWAKKHGLWDEALLKQARDNHQDHVDAWYNLNQRNQIDAALQRVNRFAPRLTRINMSNDGETKSFDWWRKRTRENDTDVLALGLRKSGIVYTGGPDITDPRVRTPKPPTTSPLTKQPPRAKVQEQSDSDKMLATMKADIQKKMAEVAQ